MFFIIFLFVCTLSKCQGIDLKQIKDEYKMLNGEFVIQAKVFT